CNMASPSRVPNRYCCGSLTRYCTLMSTCTMFSSRVSTGTLVLKVLIAVALTFSTDSIGHGSLRCGPGCSTRAVSPKRSTTPRCCSVTSTKQLNTSHNPTATSTQRPIWVVPPLPPPWPNRPRSWSRIASTGLPVPRLRGGRPPALPELSLPGVYQVSPAPPTYSAAVKT